MSIANFRWTGLATHTRGFLITGIGVLVLTPDTLLLRLADLDIWTATFWRDLALGLVLMLGVAVVHRRATIRVFLTMGWAGLSVAFLFGANGILFVVAISNTGVANTLVIYATAPVFAALLSWIFLRERASLELWVVIFLSCAGIAIVVWDGVSRGTLLGDLAALFVAITMAGMFVILRAARSSQPDSRDGAGQSGRRPRCSWRRLAPRRRVGQRRLRRCHGRLHSAHLIRAHHPRAALSAGARGEPSHAA